MKRVLIHKDIFSTYEGKVLHLALSDQIISYYFEHPSYVEWASLPLTNLKRFLFYTCKSLIKVARSIFKNSTHAATPFGFILYLPQAFNIYKKSWLCNSSYVHAGHDITYSVIDSQIRFSGMPLYQKSFSDIFYIASYLHTYFCALQLIKQFKPAMSVSLYTCYCQHLGFINACVDSRVPVYFAYRGDYFLSRFNSTYPFHSKDFSRAKSIRNALTYPLLSRVSEISQMILDSRKHGISIGQSYMRKTAFSGQSLSPEAIGSISSSIVLFLHDFYDSPHIYPGLDFSDFIDWSINTIKFLISTGKEIFVKPHPNQIQVSRPISELIFSLFPQVNILQADISNDSIFKANPQLIITAYGNVSAEAAMYGVRSVCAVPFSPGSFSDLSKASLDRQTFFDNILKELGPDSLNSDVSIDSLALGLSALSVYIEEDDDISLFFEVTTSLKNFRHTFNPKLSWRAQAHTTDMKKISSFINNRFSRLP